MKVLVAGGFGFAGGRLAQHMQRAGYQVILGSRKANEPPDWLPQAEVVRLDWNSVDALEAACSGADVVIQAAGMNAQDCAVDPVAALMVNGVATARLMEAASRVAVKRFVYLSTAHVYASSLKGRVDEETCPRNLHPYATSRLAAENAVLGASRQGGTQGIVLRLSNGFGAPAHRDANCWMLLVNGLCKQAVGAGQMILQSTGLQHRDFIAMSEICRLTESLIDRSFDAGVPGIVNIGSGRSQPVREMARFIQQRCQAVLNFYPQLTWSESVGEEEHFSLDYRSNGLSELNLMPRIDNTAEVDGLLAFCAATFGERPEI
ncbi:MAG: NAD-dependent epimerase/dehydratase [Sulfuritalea sp.]|jgi:UDP-glucose 4-epimerase|nr:NAD-dependent epimerase/dehydratase [Sulfuritalea sp.]